MRVRELRKKIEVRSSVVGEIDEVISRVVFKLTPLVASEKISNISPLYVHEILMEKEKKRERETSRDLNRIPAQIALTVE
jgi:hypothetical protein